MKTNKEKIEVMQDYENGQKIKIELDFDKSVAIFLKSTHGEIEWDWKNCKYEIEEELEHVPFDFQDYEGILGKKIRHVKKSFTGILTMVCSEDRMIVIANKEFSIALASEHLFWYNETINDWMPCTKTTIKLVNN